MVAALLVVDDEGDTDAVGRGLWEDDVAFTEEEGVDLIASESDADSGEEGEEEVVGEGPMDVVEVARMVGETDASDSGGVTKLDESLLVDEEATSELGRVVELVSFAWLDPESFLPEGGVG